MLAPSTVMLTGMDLIGRLGEIRRAVADRLAALDVHRVVDGLARPFGAAIFHQRRNHGGLVAARNHGGGDGAGGFEQIGRLDHAGERLLDALHLADRNVELRAHPRIGGRRTQHAFRRSRTAGGQRNRTARREAAHQHPPALADMLLAADDPIERDEDVLAPGRAVREGVAARQMPPADLHAFMACRNQRQRNADILALAEQIFRVGHVEGEAQQCRVGRERDVALVPVQPDADDLLAIMHAARHGADIAHRGRVGAGIWAGERETRDFLARAPGAAGSAPSARPCRISRSARPVRANWAP